MPTINWRSNSNKFQMLTSAGWLAAPNIDASPRRDRRIDEVAGDTFGKWSAFCGPIELPSVIESITLAGG
jgi:hypothetical protein